MDLSDPKNLKGMQAAKLRQKKFAALRAFRLPENALAGSLSLTHQRCGKQGCRCGKPDGAPHPRWFLTFTVDGKKHVESVPSDWVEEVQRRVAAGREAKQALTDVLTANAELLGLERRERVRRRKKRK